MTYGKKITIESYDNSELTSTKIQYEIPVHTSREQVLKDLIDALTVLTSGETRKLELDIAINQAGNWRLIKRWIGN